MDCRTRSSTTTIYLSKSKINPRYLYVNICQSQSVNLFFIPPKATEPQETHDAFLQYINDVHWYGAKNLKSLYYLRSDAARATENVNIKIPRINLGEVECIACEG